MSTNAADKDSRIRAGSRCSGRLHDLLRQVLTRRWVTQQHLTTERHRDDAPITFATEACYAARSVPSNIAWYSLQIGQNVTNQTSDSSSAHAQKALVRKVNSARAQVKGDCLL